MRCIFAVTLLICGCHSTLAQDIPLRYAQAYSAMQSIFALPILVGIGIATLTLSHFSIKGFAPDGRFPTMAALLYATAVGLVSLTPCPPRDHFRPKRTRRATRRRTTDRDPDETTAP
jgi:hypothetical protein